MNPKTLSFLQLQEAMDRKIELAHVVKKTLDDHGITLDEFIQIINHTVAPEDSQKKSGAHAPKKKTSKKKALVNTGKNYKPKSTDVYVKDGVGYTGIGRKPKWVIELQSAGGDLEKYRI